MLLSSCASQGTATTIPEQATAEPIPEETIEVTREVGDGISQEYLDERCSLVYDYEIPEDYSVFVDAASNIPEMTSDDRILGSIDAPVKIVIYADFQCSACASLSTGFKQIQELYPDTVSIAYRNFPLSYHENAFAAAIIAEAAGRQGAFWDMATTLYYDQATWYALSEEELLEYALSKAEELGLDVSQFQEDLTDKDLQAALEQEVSENATMGIGYTPFVIINGNLFLNSMGEPNILSLISVAGYGGYEECPPMVIENGKAYTAEIITNYGTITAELFPESAPTTVNSFIFLAQNDWYDGVAFHRIVEDFIAQAGDPSGLGYLGSGYLTEDEIDPNLTFDGVGVLAMAKANDDENGSQFFITLVPSSQLDGEFTIFGQVSEDSFSVLESLPATEGENVPDGAEPVIIEDILIIEN
jgi:cyclophilin family peptidyl-prolyl cis-trans isomerase/protein-disulfide isomerase